MADPSLGQSLNKMADNQMASQGLRDSNTLYNNTVAASFTWVEPKSGFFANVFPSDSTYHPLYNHDYLEITQNLAAAQSLPSEQQASRKQAIKDIVVGSYYMGYMRVVYLALIILCVMVVLYFLFKSNTWVYGAGICAVIGGIAYGAAQVYGVGEGESYWVTFENDLKSRLQNKTLAQVEKEYDDERQQAANRDMLAKASTGNYVASNNSNMGTSFVAGLLGGLLASKR